MVEPAAYAGSGVIVVAPDRSRLVQATGPKRDDVTPRHATSRIADSLRRVIDLP